MTRNPDPDGYWALRTCLSEPLPEHAEAAALLSKAADAILGGDLELARSLARQADMPVLFEQTNLVMNGGDPNIQRRRPISPREPFTKVESRMPSAEATRALFARDGWRCRFCEIRVIPPKARDAMRMVLPGAIPWSEANGFHGGFIALSASVDHVVPHSAGGGNDESNIVTACWACQFGRGAWSLEEVGLFDPRDRAPIRDEWNGLVHLLGRSAARVVPPQQTAETVFDHHDVPPPLLQRSRLAEAEWFAALDALNPMASSRLLSFLKECADLGVTWSLDKVLLVRMTAGGKRLNLVGVQQNGFCEIPWSIGNAKKAFREFSETLISGMTRAIAYETPKMWVVSRPDKQRIDVLSLLDAAPALRRAMEALRVELMVGE